MTVVGLEEGEVLVALILTLIRSCSSWNCSGGRQIRLQVVVRVLVKKYFLFCKVNPYPFTETISDQVKLGMKWIGQRTLNCWILSNHEKVKWARKSLECMTCVFRFSICEVPHRHPAISEENFAWLLFITKQFSQRFKAHDVGQWACGLSFEASANTSRRESNPFQTSRLLASYLDVNVLKIMWSTHIQ